MVIHGELSCCEMGGVETGYRLHWRVGAACSELLLSVSPRSRLDPQTSGLEALFLESEIIPTKQMVARPRVKLKEKQRPQQRRATRWESGLHRGQTIRDLTLCILTSLLVGT